MDSHSQIASTSLTLRVKVGEGQVFEGALVQFTGGTLSAQFWGADLPNLALGAPLDVQIRGLSVHLPGLPACALERSELHGGRSYRFGYTLTPEFLSRIPSHLQGLFPFRVSHRVHPSGEDPVVAMVAPLGGEHWHQAQIRDISTAGVGMVVSREVEAALSGDGRVQVELRFPTLGPEACSNLVAIVQHRHLVGEKVRYGMAFAKGHDDASQAKALSQYIVQRERKGD
ncbi:MAG: hypothetical protein R3F17_08590 [Planctomycetota bacterium]